MSTPSPDADGSLKSAPVKLSEQPTVLPGQQPPSTEPLGSAADGELPEHFGNYHLLKKIGAGGMGAVYLAEDTVLNRQVALKVPFLHGSDAANIRSRFLQEARSAAALRHPNICPIHELGEIEGVPYLTMAFITGEPLTRRLRADQPLALSLAVGIVCKLAQALQAAHEGGVIHRDLKPSNIMMDERDEPILMDFGVARRKDARLDFHLTQEGQIIGTPAYMPPEQLEGDVQAMGPGCDVYSLGVVLYELLTGTTPFQGDLVSLMSQIALEPPLPPSRRRPEVTPALDAVCLKALAKKAAERWASMNDMAAGLTAAMPLPAIAASPLFVHGGQHVDEAGPTLTLRVAGTSFAYRPAPAQQIISVGRQRRALGDPPDHGNDFVLRITGNDQLSTRISRRHFEIHHSPDGYFVVDRSKLGLSLNGQALSKNMATLLHSGDRLLVASVVTLEVLIQPQPVCGLVSALVQVPAAAAVNREQVVMEASMGDMITME